MVVFHAVLLTAFMVAASGRGTGGGATPPTRASVEAALHKHAGSFGPADVRALGPGVDTVFQQIAADRQADPELRGRAVTALSFSRSAEARRFLLQLIARSRSSSDAVQQQLLRRAVAALGWMGGPDAVDVLAGVLDHPEPGVRVDVVLALGMTRSPEAVAPLRARLADETNPEVRDQIARQLSLLQKPTPPP